MTTQRPKDVQRANDRAGSARPDEHTLTIWDDSADPVATAGAVFRWTGYSETDSVRSLLRYVDAHGDRLRSKYAAWVHELGEHRIGDRRVIDHLMAHDDLSYWWMTLFVEQSPWKSPAITDAIRLLAIEDIVTELRPRELQLVGGDHRIDAVLRAFCGDVGIAYTRTLPKGSARVPKAHWIRRLIPHSARAVIYLWLRAAGRWRLRSAKPARWMSGEQSVLFCSYFIHLDVALCRSGHFHSRHWESIPKLLHDAGVGTNWIHHYLPSSSVPDTKTALSWVHGFNARPADEGVHTFLDACLSTGVLLRALKRWKRLKSVASALPDIHRAFTPSGSRMSLWPVMRDEWQRTTRGAIAMENMLWIELFDAALRDLPRQRLGLFLYENQSWERAFIHAWRTHGHGRLIGVSHSTVRFWDLRYFLDRRTLDAKSPHPLPQADVIALNGIAAIEAFQEGNYPMERTAPSEAQRYMYLHGRTKAMVPKRERPPATKVLILGDYLPAGTIKMLRLLEGAMRHVSSRTELVIKPHPNFMVQAADYPSLDLTIVTEPLATIIDGFDVAYSSNNTSAAVDAYFAGLPVVVGLDDDDLNFSPMRGRPQVRFVSTPDELAAAIESVHQLDHEPPRESGSGKKRTEETFFFLDPDFPRWKQLLGIERPAAR